MVSCVTPPSSVEDNWQLVGWLVTSIMVMGFGTFTCWNDRWYAYVRSKFMILFPKMVMVFFIILLAVGNGWSGWRFWNCENWDVYSKPLFVFIFMIIVEGLFWPAFHLGSTLWFALFFAFATTALSITYLVFAGFRGDIWIILIGIADVAVGIIYTIGTSYLISLPGSGEYKNIMIEYNNTKDTLVVKELRTHPFEKGMRNLMATASTLGIAGSSADIVAGASPGGVSTAGAVASPIGAPLVFKVY